MSTRSDTTSFEQQFASTTTRSHHPHGGLNRGRVVSHWMDCVIVERVWLMEQSCGEWRLASLASEEPQFVVVF